MSVYERAGPSIGDLDGTAPPRVPILSRLLATRSRSEVRQAIGEFLAGRPVIVAGPDGLARLALPVDAIVPGALRELRTAAGAPLSMAVSPTRAAAMGAGGGHALRFELPESMLDAAVLELAAGADARLPAATEPADRIDEAAIEIAKLAKLLPAVVTLPVSALAGLEGLDTLARVGADDVLSFRAGHAASLRWVSSAPVPLRTVSDCELMVFRDELGQSWSLIRVGRPDTDGPVPVRLHSACLTGDAFASLRCDCGDQLQMALAKIESLGGGALLYLAQEGCGIGLANKMRAYRLQDHGLDTVDANTALGFEADERRYEIAARMLRAAGIDQVALLTNNPSKLAALRAAGIDVRERIPLIAPVGARNRGYLEAKRRRAGHLMGDVPLRVAV